jgi:hypothetical protein
MRWIGNVARKKKIKEIFNINKDKRKSIPLQAWTGPEGCRSLELPDLKTIGT